MRTISKINDLNLSKLITGDSFIMDDNDLKQILRINVVNNNISNCLLSILNVKITDEKDFFYDYYISSRSDYKNYIYNENNDIFEIDNYQKISSRGYSDGEFYDFCIEMSKKANEYQGTIMEEKTINERYYSSICLKYNDNMNLVFLLSYRKGYNSVLMNKRMFMVDNKKNVYRIFLKNDKFNRVIKTLCKCDEIINKFLRISSIFNNKTVNKIVCNEKLFNSYKNVISCIEDITDMSAYERKIIRLQPICEYNGIKMYKNFLLYGNDKSKYNSFVFLKDKEVIKEKEMNKDHLKIFYSYYDYYTSNNYCMQIFNPFNMNDSKKEYDVLFKNTKFMKISTLNDNRVKFIYFKKIDECWVYTKLNSVIDKIEKAIKTYEELSKYV